MIVFVTGTGGFIGNHLAHRLARDGHEVIGIDNLSPYYNVGLKRARLKRLDQFSNIRTEIIDLTDSAGLKALVFETKPDIVFHLAAQPGVRYSLDHPESYIDSNLAGFANLLEACRASPPQHLVFASSSSVYGANQSFPSAEAHRTAHPVSLYAATKLANEAMAHSYSDLFNMPMTGVRLFTVYGEWGRPDMAFFKFTEAILNGRALDLYNHGRMARDFTYVGDVVECLSRLMDNAPLPGNDADNANNASGSRAPFRILNIGRGAPVEVTECIRIIENTLGRKAKINLLDMQPGDVEKSWADISELSALIGYRPETPVETGLVKFIGWYRDYHKVS